MKQFQESVALEADGLAGIKTQTALFNGTLDDGVTQVQTLSKSEINNNIIVGENVEIESEVINNKIKESLRKAKNEITNSIKGAQDFTDAHSLIIKYNNEMISIYDKSDPLYKSLGGGTRFVYFARLVDGTYVCADNDTTKGIVELSSSPALNEDNISC